MKKTFLFDLDGTLADSMDVWANSMLYILERANVTYPDGIIIKLATMGGPGCVKYLRENLGVKFSENEIYEMYDDFCKEKYASEIKLKDGVKEFLQKIKNDGNSLNVLTGNTHLNLEPCLENNNVLHLFDNLWCADDFLLQKTDEKIYKLAVQKAGGKVENTIFFDDNINAIKTAKQAGLQTVGVYDESGAQFFEQMKHIADKTILSFTELL